MAAVLPDGARGAGSGFISPQEDICIHIEPYKAHAGRLHGRLQLRGLGSPNHLDGTLQWLKPAQIKDRLYPAGFDSTLDLLASIHTPTLAGNRLLTFPTANLTLSAGNLPSPLVIPVSINAANFASPLTLGAEKLRLILTPSTGTLSGKFIPPGGTTFVKFSGLILKKQNLAEGYFTHPPNKDPPSPRQQNQEARGLHRKPPSFPRLNPSLPAPLPLSSAPCKLSSSATKIPTWTRSARHSGMPNLSGSRGWRMLPPRAAARRMRALTSS